MEVSLNQTKQRVVDEAKRHDGLVWVTGGYTIENYVDSAVLNCGVAAAYPEVGKGYEVATGEGGGKWVALLSAAFKDRDTRPEKVLVAQG